MTQPAVTTAAVPYQLRQGVKAKPMPAKQHPVHKAAVAQAAKATKQARGK